MFRYTIATLLAATAFAAGDIDYTQNGLNWGETHDLCDTGVEQSPIDLTTTGTTPSDDMNLLLENYTDFKIDADHPELKREDGSVYVPMTEGDFTLTFPDGSVHNMEALQLHFHAPSEHTVDGVLYDLEVHFVHLYEDGSLGAVIGVFFDREAGGNEDNAFLNGLWEQGEEASINVKTFFDTINMEEYWNYDGSLTTPGCNEGIKWTVIKEVQPINDLQLGLYTEMWAENLDFAGGNGNNRLVQPLNDRILYFKGDASVAELEEGLMGIADGAYIMSVASATLTATLAYLAF